MSCARRVASLAVVGVVSAFVAGPAPAASRLVFTSDRTGFAQAYSVAASGGGLSQLTFARRDVCGLQPSPDGARIAYLAPARRWPSPDDFGYTFFPTCVGALWVAGADGREAHELVPDGVASFAWAPDSRRIAYFDERVGDPRFVGLWLTAVRPTGAGQATRLTSTDGGSPAWSPDGRRLAFISSQRGQNMLVVWSRSSERVVAGDAPGPVAWAPNGAWIAFTCGSGYSISGYSICRVQPDGSGLGILTSSAGPFAWGPTGAVLAVSTAYGISIGNAAGRGRVLAAGARARSIAWSPEGDAVAVTVGKHRVLRVGLDGRARVVYRGAGSDTVDSLAWARQPPTGTQLRGPEQPSLEQVGPRELRARFPINELAANGDRAFYRLCDIVLAVWQPGQPTVTPIGAHSPPACRHFVSRGVDTELALAGDRASWLFAWSRAALRSASLPNGQTQTIAESDYIASAGSLIGYLLGDGSDLVYSTWTYCYCAAGASGDDVGDPPYTNFVSSQRIFRLEGTKQVQIAQLDGAYEPLALAAGRLVVRRHLTGIDVLSHDGSQLLAFDTGARVLAAELAGDDLIVLVRGELRDYDARTGSLVHAWPLPAAVRGAWIRCLRKSGCPTDVALAGAAAGRVAYLLDGKLVVLRLADGATTTIGDATSALLDSAGLFYAWRGPDPWVGRLTFVPIDRLPVG